MKWLKIKKFLKISSVIICSIFIFSNKSFALETYTIDYDKFNFNQETYKDRADEILNYLKQYENDYYIFLNVKNNSEIQIYLILKSNIIENNSYYKLDTSSTFVLSFSGTKIKYFQKTLYSDNTNFETEFNNFKNEIENNNYKLTSNHYSVSISSALKYDYKLENNILNPYRVVYYNNFDILYSEDSDFILNIDNKVINPGNNFLTYYEFINQEKPVKYRMQFNNDVSPNLKQITFDFGSYEFTEGSNPVKTKIEIGTWNEDVSLSNYLSQVITGYGTNNIETNLTSYFNISIDTTDYLTTKELNFTYTLKKDLPNDILRIKVYYDFETFDDNYYFNVFDNATWSSVFWNYVENFLVGYKKYEFPKGYDIAIIRSKNFKDLESYYISDKIYFTSPEYNFNLKIYDFNNKIEKYNFISLTQYLINPVYLKIPIKIEETNNIFPVLTKPKNNESGTFYLKDDLFVQFVNSENLESVVDGITEEDFNDNNDLVIGGDIGNLIPPEEQEESLTIFFNQFWKMFEKFSDILSYITACFSEFYLSLPTTIQFFLCVSFAFVIYKMLIFFIL